MPAAAEMKQRPKTYSTLQCKKNTKS